MLASKAVDRDSPEGAHAGLVAGQPPAQLLARVASAARSRCPGSARRARASLADGSVRAIALNGSAVLADLGTGIVSASGGANSELGELNWQTGSGGVPARSLPRRTFLDLLVRFMP